MSKSVHEETVELLLAAMSSKPGDGLRASFMFGKPGTPHWQHNVGTEVYFNSQKLMRTALHVRQNGPTYLRYLAISDISGMLRRFAIDNFGYLADDVFLLHNLGCYTQLVRPQTAATLVEVLSNSKIFSPINHITLFPLVPVRVLADFKAPTFFLIAPSSLADGYLPPEIALQHFEPTQFPPIRDWDGIRHTPSSWLGVHSPAEQASVKMKAAILGGLALTPQPQNRHVFSERKMFGGRCTITDTASFSFGGSHTPPMMDYISITEDDHGWLEVLAEKLLANEKAIRRQIKALEYFYRAWDQGPSERFPILCMALDAIFGDANHATKSVIDGVRGVLGPHIRQERLSLLMGLRASVIHGGAPDVYDSRKYAKYFDAYEADPIHDLELVVAKCLRQVIFGDALKEHADPGAELIAEAKMKGMIPKTFEKKSILDDTV